MICKKKIAALVVKKLKQRGFGAREKLAAEVGCTVDTIRNIEKGTFKPSAMMEVCRILGIDSRKETV